MGCCFHLEHVRPTSAGGSDALGNRALSCPACNLAKGDQTEGADPETGVIVRLFDPRSDDWHGHFRWGDPREILVGLTPIGRATVVALDMNNPLRLTARRLWFATGWLP